MLTRSLDMLFYSYTLIWLLVFFFMIFLSQKIRKLEKKYDELEHRAEEAKK
jgi:CcmD family protein